MHPAQIQAALKMRGYSQIQIASEVGADMDRTTVWQVIHGRGRSKRVELAVAAATGLPLIELWPQWYGPNARKRGPKLTQQQLLSALRAVAG